MLKMFDDGSSTLTIGGWNPIAFGRREEMPEQILSAISETLKRRQPHAVKVHGMIILFDLYRTHRIIECDSGAEWECQDIDLAALAKQAASDVKNDIETWKSMKAGNKLDEISAEARDTNLRILCAELTTAASFFSKNLRRRT